MIDLQSSTDLVHLICLLNPILQPLQSLSLCLSIVSISSGQRCLRLCTDIHAAGASTMPGSPTVHGTAAVPGHPPSLGCPCWVPEPSVPGDVRGLIACQAPPVIPSGCRNLLWKSSSKPDAQEVMGTLLCPYQTPLTACSSTPATGELLLGKPRALLSQRFTAQSFLSAKFGPKSQDKSSDVSCGGKPHDGDDV